MNGTHQQRILKNNGETDYFCLFGQFTKKSLSYFGSLNPVRPK